MKTTLEIIKIEMTYEEGKQLKEQLLAKVNEFLQVINVRDELPF